MLYKAKRKIEQAKAQVHAKIEHPLRVIKPQLDHTNVRFWELVKNTTQLVTAAEPVNGASAFAD